jgi:hypothetical protein
MHFFRFESDIDFSVLQISNEYDGGWWLGRADGKEVRIMRLALFAWKNNLSFHALHLILIDCRAGFLPTTLR